MNTERNMKRKGSLFPSIVLSLFVSVSGGLIWGGTLAQAAIQAQAGGSAQSSTTSQASATAASTTVDSTLSIPVSATVTMADGTSIALSGNVTVNSSAVMDVVGIPPFLMLTFDCSGVTATSGTPTARKMYDTSGFQVNKIRMLQPSDTVVITVPINQTAARVTLASTWQVTANLSFNTTGQLTGGTLAAASAPTAAQ
jgi:hypothetical protein